MKKTLLVAALALGGGCLDEVEDPRPGPRLAEPDGGRFDPDWIPPGSDPGGYGAGSGSGSGAGAARRDAAIVEDAATDGGADAGPDGGTDAS